MKLDAHGLEFDLPAGWEGRITKREGIEPDGATTTPVLHAATFPLPEDRGDYGSKAVEAMGRDDVFVALLEFGEEAVNSALFAPGRLPRTLDPEGFRNDGMQRWIPGQAAYQKFFTQDDRAFVLYIVIGNYANRIELARKAEALVATIQVQPPDPRAKW